MSNGAVDYKLDLETADTQLMYAPWNVRTLKIRVSVSEDKQNKLPPLRLRPQRQVQMKGAVCGLADESDAFLISWGGGHEAGPCIKADDEGHVEGCVQLKANQTSNIFLNVHHRGPDTPETAVLSLEAYDPTNNQVYASLKVNLVKTAVDVSTIQRLTQTNPGVWEIKAGNSLPTYDPRWHPKADVAYVVANPLPLQIQQDEFKLRVLWDGKLIAVIDDRTRPSMLDANLDSDKYLPGGVYFDLFQWDAEFVVLRAWFFWLNTNIPDHIITVGRHEVPDAERFDFLIRRKTGHIGLACTDLHWREMWGRREEMEKTVTGYMGFTGSTLLRTGLNHILDTNMPSVLPGDLIIKKNLPNDLLLEFIKREAAAFAKADDKGKETLLDAGNQAHVPTLGNIGMDPLLVGQDVRQE